MYKNSIWIYSIAIISCFSNVYFAYKNGNDDAFFAWIVSACLSAGALGAHLKIKELQDK